MRSSEVATGSFVETAYFIAGRMKTNVGIYFHPVEVKIATPWLVPALIPSRRPHQQDLKFNFNNRLLLIW